MSTDIGTIQGRFERVKSVSESTVEYRPSELHLTRFSGGEKMGVMLQMTIQQKDGNMAYIQLTRDQVKELVVKLKEEFNIGSYKL